MAHGYSPVVNCFNLLATAWLCAYCCAPRPVAVVTTGASVGGGEAAEGANHLPLVAVAVDRMDRMDR